MDGLAQVRHLLPWSPAAGLAFLALYGVIVSRSLTGGGAIFFVIAAAIATPHAFWNRYIAVRRYIVMEAVGKKC
jgi:hypothetical protein